MSLTINTTINGTLSLAPSNNPIAITASGGVAATATLADAIDGDSSTAWMISNAGTISSASGFGLYLNGPSSNLSNSGSISGAGGMFLNNGGSVTNTASGTITATGKMPSSLATISGIYVTGPSGARPFPSPTPASSLRPMATASDWARAEASTTPAR